LIDKDILDNNVLIEVAERIEINVEGIENASLLKVLLV